MKMKKYYASSIPEAMKQVRAELGEDAVILNSKVIITKKFFGMIKKKSFEVVAGVDTIEPTLVAPAPPATKDNARLQELTNAIQAKIHQDQPQPDAVNEDTGI